MLQNDQSSSDSDSSWDDDDDFATKKINIEIKPIAQLNPNTVSVSVDELRATVGTWKSLANINLVKPNSRRHHQSTLNLNNIEKINDTIQPKLSASSIIAPKTLELPIGILPQPIGLRERSSIDSNGTSNLSELTPTTDLFSQHLSNGNLRSTSAILSPGLQSAFSGISTNDDTIKLPVAFAIQECFNANILETEQHSSIIGHVKVAVPPKIVNLDKSCIQGMEITLLTSVPWKRVELDSKYVQEKENFNQLVPSDLSKTLIVDMEEIQKYVEKQYQTTQAHSKYYVIELLRYTIGSQDKKELSDVMISRSTMMTDFNPVHISSHWLCDSSTTKIRVDLNLMDGFGLLTDDIRNLKISMQVNGGVTSCQSKPQAKWNPSDSRLTWSSNNLTELCYPSGGIGITSCLARFDLDGGPSIPSEVSLQFSIVGKTLSGSHILLNDTKNFCLSTQKFEVRTGTYKSVSSRV